MSLWNQPGIPHKGWQCLDVVDVRDGEMIAIDDAPYESCEMCGKEQVRFVHVMTHPHYVGPLRVGGVCAGKMEDAYAASRREKAARSRSARRSRWLSRRWRTSTKGNPFLNVDGRNLVVFRRGRGWSFGVDGKFHRSTFPSEEQAKLALFDHVWPSAGPVVA
jgi:hypothetical protein